MREQRSQIDSLNSEKNYFFKRRRQSTDFSLLVQGTLHLRLLFGLDLPSKIRIIFPVLLEKIIFLIYLYVNCVAKQLGPMGYPDIH